MKIFLLITSYIVTFAEFCLACFFLKTNAGNQIRKAMAFLSLATALWVMSTTLGAYDSAGSWSIFFARSTYVFGIMLVTGLFIFSIVYPFPTTRLDRLHIILLAVPIIIFSSAIFFSEAIILQYHSTPTFQGEWNGGRLYNVYNSYLFFLYIASLANLFYKLRKTDGSMLINLKAVLWSIILGGAPAVIMDLIVPLIKNSASMPLIGTSSTVIWLGITTYIVVKK